MEITLEKYLSQQKELLSQLEKEQQFEECAALRDFIREVEEKNVEGFVKRMFDIRELTNVGFFTDGFSFEQMAEKIVKFFGIESIFHYLLINQAPGTSIHISYINPAGKPFLYQPPKPHELK